MLFQLIFWCSRFNLKHRKLLWECGMKGEAYAVAQEWTTLFSGTARYSTYFPWLFWAFLELLQPLLPASCWCGSCRGWQPTLLSIPKPGGRVGDPSTGCHWKLQTHPPGWSSGSVSAAKESLGSGAGCKGAGMDCVVRWCLSYTQKLLLAMESSILPCRWK